jgi:hypothetical protein
LYIDKAKKDCFFIVKHEIDTFVNPKYEISKTLQSLSKSLSKIYQRCKISLFLTFKTTKKLTIKNILL